MTNVPYRWVCQVCRRERPDDKIEVAHRAIRGHESAFPGTRANVKYCVDNPECVAAATADEPWDI